ncbi:glycosyl hydrolase [Candidatus Frankia alpina]|uniref:glycosyl hydrolase n=1 Tax=Candidatus Frankia alpina TaxID=2699483 RepID=UPI001F1C9824|nr:glycosyl hydrolase [Candidatus Frankia alpina]
MVLLPPSMTVRAGGSRTDGDGDQPAAAGADRPADPRLPGTRPSDSRAAGPRPTDSSAHAASFGTGLSVDPPTGPPTDTPNDPPLGPPLDAPTNPLSERAVLVHGRPPSGQPVDPPDWDEGTALFQIRRPGARGDDPGWPGDPRADLTASPPVDHEPPTPPVRVRTHGPRPGGETDVLRWSETGVPPRDSGRRDDAESNGRHAEGRDDSGLTHGIPRTGGWTAARDAWLAADPRNGGRWAPLQPSGPAASAAADGPAARGHDGTRARTGSAGTRAAGRQDEGRDDRRTGQDRGGSERTGIGRAGSGRVAPERVRSDRTRFDRVGTDRSGPDRVALDSAGLGRRAAWSDGEAWSDEGGSARAPEAAKVGARHADRSDDRAAPVCGRRARAAVWITDHWGGNASRVPHLPVIAVSVAVVLTLVAVTALLLVPSSSGGGADPIATSARRGASPAAQSGTAARPTLAGAQVAAVPQVERAATTGLFPTGVAAHSLAQANTWARFRGRPNDVVVMYTDRSSWSSLTDPWMGHSTSTFAGYAGTWVLTQPLFPDSGPEKGNLADCAAGNYDAKWQQFGRWLVNMGRGDSFVRLGWEFNGLWFAWAATDPQQWIQCFRNASSAIKATSPKARIDWNLNAHGSTTSVGAFDLYPGDQYVDVIGVDSYDQYPPSPTYADFDNQCNADAGLCQVITFARTHHKLFSVPEWGVVSQQGTKAGRSGAAGGDNPAYMEKMYETFAHNADILAYEAYFPDAEEGNVRSSLVNPDLNPASAAAYQRLWG